MTLADVIRLRLGTDNSTETARKPKAARVRRNPYRGITLLAPDAKHPSWRARYRDPEGPGMRVETIPEAAAKTVDTRRDWAIDKRRTVELRRAEIAGGAAPHAAADMKLDAAIAKYFEDWGRGKRPRTIADYRRTCDLFLDWAKTVDLRTCRQLTKAHLASFAAARTRVPKLAGATKRRGKRTKSTGEPRSLVSVNRELRDLSSVLNTLRDMDLIRLGAEDIGAGLKRHKTETELGEYLRPAQLRALIVAARKHDAELFTVTRKRRRRGDVQPPRYTPVLPVILFFLLAGTRVKEGLAIEWPDVDLDAGEITVRARTAKTKRARVIKLDITPVLAAMLARASSATGLVLDRTVAELDAARTRLVDDYNAPAFTYQMLRRTCGTYLTCAPSIYGAASAYMSARRLGHSVTIAEKHYVGVVTISPDARTLEAALQLDVTIESCPRL